MATKFTKEEFIKRAQMVHGNKFDYSKVNYVNSQTKVCIVCDKHGEFWQIPSAHLSGQGCPYCKNDKLKICFLSNTNEFIEKARKIHGDKYDYSKVEYINNNTPVIIICKKHGEFKQTPAHHLSGWGCKECGKETSSEKRKDTIDTFIEKARKIHGNKYNYSKVKYVDSQTKVCIICPIHGEFWQRPNNHLNGWGCRKCGYDNASEKEKNTNGEFISIAKKIHGDKYDYSNVTYKNYKTKVCIVCKKHGKFWQTPDDHIQGKGCPRCGNVASFAEQEIVHFLREHYMGDIEERNRRILSPYEVDIYLPEKKIAIEYNGIFWHSEKYRDKNYHLKKLEEAKRKGISLIQIFEDEFLSNKEIVFSKLLHLIGCDNGEKIYGRNVDVIEVTKDAARCFLNKNHIQGYSPSTINIGAKYNDEIIGIVSFKKENKERMWELVRAATKVGVISCGIIGKMFKYFVKKYQPIEIKSFADRRWTINENKNLYVNLGFKMEKYCQPDYRYFKKEDGIKRLHKFGFRKEKLHNKYGFSKDLTENEITKKLGYLRVWDCGLIKYVWKNGTTDKETD